MRSNSLLRSVSGLRNRKTAQHSQQNHHADETHRTCMSSAQAAVRGFPDAFRNSAEQSGSFPILHTTAAPAFAAIVRGRRYLDAKAPRGTGEEAEWKLFLSDDTNLISSYKDADQINLHNVKLLKCNQQQCRCLTHANRAIDFSGSFPLLHSTSVLHGARSSLCVSLGRHLLSVLLVEVTKSD